MTGGLLNGESSTLLDVLDVQSSAEEIEAVKLCPMNQGRIRHTMTAVGCFLFVFGGSAGTYLASSECFNTTTNA